MSKYPIQADFAKVQTKVYPASSQKVWDRPFVVLATFLDRNQIFFLLLILLVAMLLRVSNLNESLWYDELWSTRLKLGDLISLWNTVLYDYHPPFYSIFMFLWIRLFGDSELLVRLPPLLFGIASIALTYKLALKFVDKKVALLTAWLLAVSPVHIWYSQEARQYSADLFFLLLSLLAYYQLDSSATKRVWYLVYTVSLLCAVFSHFFVGVFVVLISGLCLLKRTPSKRTILVLNFVILGCLGLFIVLKSRIFFATSDSYYLRNFTPYELWELLFNWFLLGNSFSHPDERLLLLLVQLFSLALFSLGTIWFARGAIRSRNLASLNVMFYLFSLPLFLMGLYVIGFRNVYIERSVLVALPFFYLILAQGIAVVARPLTTAAILLTVILNLLTLSAFFSRGDEWTVYKPKGDWRGATRYLADETRDVEERIDIFTTDQVLELTYYDPQIVEFADFQVRPHETRETAKRLLGESIGLYNVFSLEWEKHDEFLRERLANAKLIIHYPGRDGAESVSETLSRDRTQVFYLAANWKWQGDPNSLASKVVQDPKFQLQSRQTFKGIDIFKFRVWPQD